MRMSSLVKKGDGKAKSNPAGPQSKEAGSKTAPTKPGESRNADSGKAADQLNPKLLPTAEQLRIAQMISDSKRDDPDLPEKVNKLVELTNCSADAAIIALHDSNNDLDHAIAALLDGETEGDWEVSGKKKKPKQLTQQQGSSAADATEGGGTGNGTTGSGRGRDRERSRSGRGGPPRLRGRGRGRDNKENFEDAADTDGFGGGSRGRGSRGGPRMSNGPGREGSSGGRGGGRGGRGGAGFRRGPRPAPTDTWDENAGEFSTMTNVEPWSNTTTTTNNDFPSAEDWDNEEYIGSLVETKVFTPSSSNAVATAAVPDPSAVTALTNGSATDAVSGPPGQQQQTQQQQQQPQSVPPPQVHYSTLNNSAAQQGIDLNALLQKTSGVTVAGGGSLQQQFLGYGQQQAMDNLKAAMGVGGSSAASKAAAKPLRAKIPPPSKIPLSAVEMPDDPLVSGLDVKFGTLDFGIEPSGFDMGSLDGMNSSGSTSGMSKQQADHLHQQQQHSLMSKMEQQQQYGSGGQQTQQQQPPAASSLPKPDASLGGFSSSGVSSASGQQSMTNAAPAQVKSANNSAYGSYGGGASYAPPGVNTSSSQPAGAYPSANQTSTVGGYNSASASSVYQASGNQNAYGSYGQQQQQQQGSSTYQSYNNKMNSTESSTTGSASSMRGVDLPSSSAASVSRSTTTSAANSAVTNKPTGTGTTLTGSSAGLPNLPPGVPAMLGPGGFIMGQAPGLPYYAAAAAAAAGMQQHPVYSLEDMQYRYPHLAAGYYDMGYQSPTSLGTGRGDGTLASLAYATGSDASKFSRNENNSPVPTSLSQNAAQSHGGAFITPAAAAPTPLTPAYAYYYSGGVMPGGYQFGAPAALYPVSAAASGHPGGAAAGNAANQYVKAGPLGGGASGSTGGGAQSGQAQSGGAGGGAGGQSNAGGAASGYTSYGSTYDEFSKSVYGSVSAGGQATKMGGAGSAGTGGPSGVGGAASGSGELGPNVYGKTHNQLSKINTYDKTGGFHTGTPPPYGLAGNASGAPLGVGVSVGVGGPSPYGGQHMFIPTLAPHQSQHSHLMHQQLHQDSTSGPGQRSQTGQQNKQGSKPSYGGSYWGST